MRKVLLFLAFLLLIPIIIKAEDKMNPDGYIRRLSFVFEMGYDWANGNRSHTIYQGIHVPPSGGEIPIVNFVELPATIKNPFLKLQILHPTSDKFTLFLNIFRSWYWESDKGKSYHFSLSSGDLYFFYPDRSYYDRFSVSGGFKLYIK